LHDAVRFPSRASRLAILSLLAAYLIFARTRGVNESFYLLRDQIRDWRFALGSFSHLPLTGTPSTAGGASLGPIYYWVLWIARVVIGPWTGNMPHAGAIGISLLQTTADLLLLEAMRRLFQSFWLAVATTLLLATIAHDLAIAATIWNPSVSLAFVKLAVALALLAGPRPSTWRAATTTGVAWLAVQAHSSAIFVAVPIGGAFVARDLWAREWRPALAKVRATLEVIAVLQIPFLYSALTAANEAAPTRAMGGIAQALNDPERLRVVSSLNAFTHFTGRLFVVPWNEWWWAPVLAVVFLGALVRARRNGMLFAVSIAPAVLTVAGFALWQGNYDEYWYLPLTPSITVAIAATLSLWRADALAVALLAVVVVIQPWRLAHAQLLYRMPEYAALMRGSKTAARQSPVVKRVTTTFPLPPLSDSGFLYEAAGGRQDPAAPFSAVIDQHGDVRFIPVAR
jgi:hypothetical protein